MKEELPNQLQQSSVSPLDSLLGSGMVLIDSLKERLDPFILQTQPIWSDPLWQFLGSILTLVIILIVLFWLLRLIGGNLAAFAEGVKNIMFSAIKSVWRILFKSSTPAATESSSPSSFWMTPFRIKKAFDSVRYLTTRRDWRYQSSWYLLMGEEDSGKAEWVANLQQGRRTHVLSREKKLMANGSGWHFFDHGLIIDIENESDFTPGVELLNSYRPERPLDGIILTISAKKILQVKNNTTVLHEYGQTLYEKMWTVQKVTGFILPVYLVVTECDDIEGFTTFWSAWDETPANDMFGWSNPSRVDAAFSIKWVQDAFVSVVDAIRKAQLAIAATGEDISDIDSFMLFDREFQSVEAPLTEVILQGFASSSFQETLPLRGIWFSGEIAGEVALSEDLLAKKIWPEKHLAYPVEQRFFSSNKTLRSMQYASVLLFVLLGTGLMIDTYRLHSYTQSAQKSWDTIFSKTASDDNNDIYSSYCSSQGIDTWRLLNNLTKLDDQPTTPSLIFSWGGGQIDAMRQAAADSVFPAILFPAYECRLKIRANELTQLTTVNIPRHANVDMFNQHLIDYTDALTAYQKAQTQFIRLAGPLPSTKHVVRDLRQLTDYLYDGTIPASVDFGTALLVGGVMDAHYDIEWKANDLIDSTDQANYLAGLSARVRNKINEEAKSPPLDDIRRSFLASSIETGQSTTQRFSLSSSKDMLDSINTFQQWLRYISQEWLKSNNYNSPCGRFHQRLTSLNTELSAAAYSQLLLDTATAEFSDVNCDTAIRHQLVNLNVSPFGRLFVENDNNKIVFSPQLNQWINEFNALESMSIFSYEALLTSSSKAGEHAAGKIVAWNTAPLSEAIDVMLEFQSFRQKWWQLDPNKRSEPFYAPALRERLREIVTQLINQSQVSEYSQQPSPITRARDEESTLSASIVSFERAESMIRQLSTLFQQEGDIANATLLNKQAKNFVYERLDVLTQVTADNNLYTPLQRIDWKSDNLAQALFNYGDPASLSSYLENQRQRLSFLTQNYAKPLISYLIDTHTIAETNNKARLWYNTLIEMTQYDRQQPSNDINLLQQYVTTELGQQTWQQCDALLDQPQLVSTGGLFSQRHYDIDKKVRYVCKNYGKNRVVRQYFALAERFNQDIKGRFPFTDLGSYSQRSELNNLSPQVLHRFLDDYQTIWAEPKEGTALLVSLTRYLAKNPNSGLDHWLRFVKKVDRFAQFYQQVRDKDTATINLLVEFDSQSVSSKGQDQIIEWKMRSGDQTIIFPNGDNQIQWQPGQALSLSLRWAKGSVFFPLEIFSSGYSVTSGRSVAGFTSSSEWALFEWLQRFERHSTSRKMKFEFAVPVGIKAESTPASGAQETAYISRINLTASAVITAENGKQEYLAVPLNLPRFAPGLPVE